MNTSGEERADRVLVSCLCVTENRSAFMPWLLWNFTRQTWPHRELVIVDSSPEPYTSSRDDVRVIRAAPGTGVAAKRNVAMRAARGDVVAWFDDDDWQHPDRLRRLMGEIAVGLDYAGPSGGWFVDLARLRCARYRGRQVVFNGAAFRRSIAARAPFPEKVRKASDAHWLRAILTRHRKSGIVLGDDTMFFWLCHDRNLSNPARRRRFRDSIGTLRERVGASPWGDTDAALDGLRGRLRNDREPRRTRGAARVAPDGTVVAEVPSAPATDRVAARSGPSAVGVVVKATILDAPYLEIMVRHMLRQARFSFAERIVVVDRAARFRGKYADRPRQSMAELDAALDRLVSDDVIDRVVDVDNRPRTVRDVLDLYFPGRGPDVSTHATTGGPIYPTLFGMEALESDHVLQMDADVLFHTSPAGWVEEALGHMARDSRLWLMMTHPGPPAGRPGRSLGGRNSRLAKWDPRHRVWRFRTATTRYFLCDRRKLRGRLVPRLQRGVCVPLEQCISDALTRHGAWRGALGALDSWHLHAWYHGSPFPEWADALTRAVEEGRYPTMQRGRYDLRLDRRFDREAWSGLLTASRVAGGPAVTRAPEPAGLSVVIPIRDRAGGRLRNALASLRWQTEGPPAEVVVVSHGSRREIDEELDALCEESGARFMRCGSAEQPWNKPLALNHGIRATSEDVPFVMTMDADMILSPDFLAVVLDRLRRRSPALVLCRSSDLPARSKLPVDPDRLRAAFTGLRARARRRPRSGSGGIQAAPREFFFRIRGYDEKLVWWGAMDNDLVQRARLAGLSVEWVEGRTAMLHQWHPRKFRSLPSARERGAARAAWTENHALMRSLASVLVRNRDGWGHARS